MKVLRFTAGWCQPCKTLAARLQSLAIDIPAIDIDSEQGKALVAQYNIRSVPTIIVDYDGVEITKFTGANLSVAAVDTIRDALSA